MLSTLWWAIPSLGLLPPVGKASMTCRRFRKTMVKKQRSFGLERAVSQADQTGSAADGPNDDAASALSRSSSGGERVRGSTQVSKHRSQGAPGPKSLARRVTQRSTPPDP